jgi:hypothetical protein
MQWQTAAGKTKDKTEGSAGIAVKWAAIPEGIA